MFKHSLAGLAAAVAVAILAAAGPAAAQETPVAIGISGWTGVRK